MILELGPFDASVADGASEILRATYLLQVFYEVTLFSEYCTVTAPQAAELGTHALSQVIFSLIDVEYLITVVAFQVDPIVFCLVGWMHFGTFLEFCVWIISAANFTRASFVSIFEIRVQT